MSRLKELMNKELCAKALKEQNKISNNKLCTRSNTISSYSKQPMKTVSDVMVINITTFGSG
jgi:hypothetical protein